eukprot:GDKK01053685.1.p1 GENE.GDKK01053685.1~~GDKK01053685.1.p1  ORF type:complete len:160 (-),score=45.22 GDKK01053685.1:67-546(-)
MRPNVLRVLCMNPETRVFYKEHSAAHKGDSGVDLFCIADQMISVGETARIHLGIKCAAFDADGNNVSWMLFPRSSISKTPMRLANSIGLIDAGYRGEVMAAVDNIKSEDFTVKTGDKYFQAVAFNGAPMTVELVDSLDETERGEGGFGSTGVKRAKLDN